MVLSGEGQKFGQFLRFAAAHMEVLSPILFPDHNKRLKKKI